VFGDRVPIEYAIEGGKAVAWLKLREKQATRLRARDLPTLALELRFSVVRGRREIARAATLDELRESLARLEAKRRRSPPHRRRRR
jgi:hypothetical protein